MDAYPAPKPAIGALAGSTDLECEGSKVQAEMSDMGSTHSQIV